MSEAVLPTPIGGLGVTVSDGAVVGISFGAVGQPPNGPLDPVLAAALAELREYFAGSRTAFTAPFRFVRGSAFERAVWARIAAIPYGEMVTYGEIARDVGEPGGPRPWGPPVAATRCRSSCPVTAWSGPTASWSGSAAGCPASATCCNWRPGSPSGGASATSPPTQKAPPTHNAGPPDTRWARVHGGRFASV